MAGDTTFNITPTDEATVIKVDEVRAARRLPLEGGEVGGRWIAEHSAKIRADAAPQIAEAAAAEKGSSKPAQGNAPAAQPDAAPAQESA